MQWLLLLQNNFELMTYELSVRIEDRLFVWIAIWNFWDYWWCFRSVTIAERWCTSSHWSVNPITNFIRNISTVSPFIVFFPRLKMLYSSSYFFPCLAWYCLTIHFYLREFKWMSSWGVIISFHCSASMHYVSYMICFIQRVTP